MARTKKTTTTSRTSRRNLITRAARPTTAPVLKLPPLDELAICKLLPSEASQSLPDIEDGDDRIRVWLRPEEASAPGLWAIAQASEASICNIIADMFDTSAFSVTIDIDVNPHDMQIIPFAFTFDNKRRWINNKVSHRHISVYEVVPSGFTVGMLNRRKRRKRPRKTSVDTTTDDTAYPRPLSPPRDPDYWKTHSIPLVRDQNSTPYWVTHVHDIPRRVGFSGVPRYVNRTAQRLSRMRMSMRLAGFTYIRDANDEQVWLPTRFVGEVGSVVNDQIAKFDDCVPEVDPHAAAKLLAEVVRAGVDAVVDEEELMSDVDASDEEVLSDVDADDDEILSDIE